MTELVLLPHASRVVIGHLLADDDVADLLGGPHVYSDLPPEQFPAVRVTPVGGRVISGSSIYWLEETTLQLDCFAAGGSDRKQAHDLAATCAASIAQRLTGAVSFTIGTSTVDAAVTGATVGVVLDVSDTTFTPPKPYSRFDVVLVAHPSSTTGS